MPFEKPQIRWASASLGYGLPGRVLLIGYDVYCQLYCQRWGNEGEPGDGAF